MRRLELFLPATLLCFIPLTPAFCDIHIHPHASVIEEHDSNITYASDNEVSDSDTRIEAGIDAEYEGKVDNITLQSFVFRRYYNKHKEFNSNSWFIKGKLDHEFGRYDKISVSESFHRGSQPQSFTELFGRIVNGFYTFNSNYFSAEYTHELTSQFNVIARYSNSINTYSRSDISDNYENKPGLGLEYAFTSRDYALLNYSYSHIKYEPGGIVRTSDATAGFRHYFTSQVDLEALAGYAFIKNIQHERSRNPIYRLTLSDSVTDKLDAKLAYTWAYSTSAFSTDVFKNERLELDLTDQYNERLKVDTAIFYGKGTYQTSNLKTDLAGGRIGFLYGMTKYVELAVSADYERQTSNDPGSEYRRAYYSAGLRIEF